MTEQNEVRPPVLDEPETLSRGKGDRRSRREISLCPGQGLKWIDARKHVFTSSPGGGVYRPEFGEVCSSALSPGIWGIALRADHLISRRQRQHLYMRQSLL